GFANFDIMCDAGTGKFYLLEMNLRQGRSNYYMSAAGMSIAKLIVEEQPVSTYKEIFWRCIPRSIVKKRVPPSLRKTVDALRFDGREFSSFDFAKDLRDPRRALYVLIHNMRFFSKYKNE
ncbi:MAG: ATP-grasp domain-containing protein, partial [Clostridiales bacterium]|nr:ATP-grasp domain-containing protein [Clostridiales bacterium]